MLRVMTMGEVKPRPLDETAWKEIPEEVEFEHKLDCFIAYLFGLAGGMIAIFSLLF